ncbi:MAG: Bug family tripartite tricarboxylate transporter substrate binding protein [Candidatus Binatia bacterium]
MKTMSKKFLCAVSLVIGLAFITVALPQALAEEFYAGKTIRVVVGFPPGGGYDTYTRAVARHIGKYIPGNPTSIVQNMPGAGSLIAANHMYNKAKPEGLTVWIWNSGLVLSQALGDRKVRFDARNVDWIGAPSVGLPSCAVMGFTGLKTLTDVLNSKKVLKMGGTRAGSPTVDLPRILNKNMGTNFKVISGLRGTPGIRIAMQKREIDGSCWGWESMKVTARSMLDAKGDDKLIPFLIQGKDNAAEVKDLPQMTNVIKGEDKLAMFRAWHATQEFMRPWSLPPGTPKDRLEILRKAFRAAIKDPTFLAEAKKSKLLINYVSGEEIEKFVDEILGISPAAKAMSSSW